MGFIGAIGAIAMLVFIVKCGRRAVDGVEDKKTWYWLLLSMFVMSVGICWPDIYESVGTFFMLAWWAYLVNWLYKIIAHKVLKRPKAAKKDFWMPVICFVLMLFVVALEPKKEVDAPSLVADSTAPSSIVSSSIESVEEEPASSETKAESESRVPESQAEPINKPAESESQPESAESESQPESEPVHVETEDEYKASCETVGYKDLCRYPDKYAGTRIVIKVKVQQIMDASMFSNEKAWRVQDNEDGYNMYLGNEYYAVDKRDSGSVKILQDDIVTIYGKFTGTTEITRALTWTKDEIPRIEVKYADLDE